MENKKQRSEAERRLVIKHIVLNQSITFADILHKFGSTSKMFL